MISHAEYVAAYPLPALVVFAPMNIPDGPPPIGAGRVKTCAVDEDTETLKKNKRCCGCGESKPVGDFYIKSDGFMYSRCKVCIRADRTMKRSAK